MKKPLELNVKSQWGLWMLIVIFILAFVGIFKEGYNIGEGNIVEHKSNGYQLYCLTDSTFGLFDGRRLVATFTAGEDKVLDNIITQDNQ